jgi:hypothetical protein
MPTPTAPYYIYGRGLGQTDTTFEPGMWNLGDIRRELAWAVGQLDTLAAQGYTQGQLASLLEPMQELARIADIYDGQPDSERLSKSMDSQVTVWLSQMHQAVGEIASGAPAGAPQPATPTKSRNVSVWLGLAAIGVIALAAMPRGPQGWSGYR